MSHVTRHHFSFPQAEVTENARTPLCLTIIVTGLLLTLMSVLTGCGSGGETGSTPSTSAAPSVATVSLAWDPPQDQSFQGYYVHYGRQSLAHSDSCAYEHTMYSPDSAVIVHNLDPNTTYYFSVSADYNGLEGPCSEEVSAISSSPVI